MGVTVFDSPVRTDTGCVCVCVCRPRLTTSFGGYTGLVAWLRLINNCHFFLPSPLWQTMHVIKWLQTNNLTLRQWASTSLTFQCDFRLCFFVVFSPFHSTRSLHAKRIRRRHWRKKWAKWKVSKLTTLNTLAHTSKQNANTVLCCRLLCCALKSTPYIFSFYSAWNKRSL